MKKGSLFLIFLSMFFLAKSQTLFTYGKNSVSKKEFLTAYNKNKTTNSSEEKAIREYLDLYIAFKLKVQAAKDLRMDTLFTIKEDEENFRSQIEASFLKDENMVNKLIDEAFERSQKDIYLTDFFIQQPPGSDSVIYFNAANELYRLLKTKQYKENEFESENGVRPTKTDAGYITVFTLPYEYETIIYNLKPGVCSKPVRTSDGWHIFLNAGERKAVGKIRIAQILISAPENSPKERQEAKKLADSLYSLLQKGDDFSKLAKEYSHDRTSFFNEGIIPAFGVGKYSKIFEEQAFSIQRDGAVLAPFETEFGYHILKRISAEPIPSSLKNIPYNEELIEEVSNDGRIHLATTAFIKNVIRQTGMELMQVDVKKLWGITDSAILSNRIVQNDKLNEESVLLQFNDHSTVKVRDWTFYLRTLATPLNDQPEKLYPALFAEFINYSALNNYKRRLSDFSPEFNAQLQEFNEGNLLFEVMEKEVWNKATVDSAGLFNFYKKNQQKYRWNESADALIISCINETIAKKVLADFKKGKPTADILEENESLVRIDSGRYELQQIPIDKEENISVNKITQPVINDQDGTVVFAKIKTIYPANEQRSFEEARGMVISDYQLELEEKWLKELNKKYPVKINKKAFNSLLK